MRNRNANIQRKTNKYVEIDTTKVNATELYINAFDRMLKERKRRGKECKWTTGEEVFFWWMEDENIPGQMSIEDFITEE